MHTGRDAAAAPPPPGFQGLDCYSPAALRLAERAIDECGGDTQVALAILEREAELAGIDLRAADARNLLRTVGHIEYDVPAPDDDVFPTLAALAADPDLLAPPRASIPRLAWPGRGTMLVAPPKSGKSTLAGAAAAVKSQGGYWLGERLEPGRVLVVAPDEPAGDTVRRLVEMRADGSRIRVLAARPPDLWGALRAILVAWPADLVIVDSLLAYARAVAGVAPEDGDTSGWAQIIRPPVELVHDLRSVALLLLHHTRRSDNQFRGSGELAAAVDAVVTMYPPAPGTDATVRRFEALARWSIPSYSLRWAEGVYELVGGADVSTDAATLAFVAGHPGCSLSAIREHGGGRHGGAVDAALRALVARGAITERPGRRGARTFWPSSGQADLGVA